MPYKLSGTTVLKDTGEVVKRHKTRKQALAHLAALTLNVNEANGERDYKKEYATYQGKPDQIKKRASRNKARRLMIAKGLARIGDGKDVDHKNSNPLDNSAKNLRVISKSKNRAMNESDHLIEAGARNSQVDQQRIQAAHDTLVELGAVCRGHNSRMMPEALTLTPFQTKAIGHYLEHGNKYGAVDTANKILKKKVNQ